MRTWYLGFMGNYMAAPLTISEFFYTSNVTKFDAADS